MNGKSKAIKRIAPTGTTVPCSPETETAVIGVLLACAEETPRVDRMLSHLRPELFHEIVCQELYKSIAALRKQDNVADCVTVYEHNKTRVNALGGIPYLSGLPDKGTPTAFDSYLATLGDKAARRQTIAAAHDLVSAANDPRLSADKFAETRNTLALTLALPLKQETEAEMWSDPVNGAAVFNEVSTVLKQYVSFPGPAADAVALWITHAHVFEAFTHTPRLNIRAPEKGCGKSTLLDIINEIVPRPIKADSVTPAVLFRLVEARKPTVLLDELDTYLKNSDELRGLINAGHKRGGCAYRCEGEDNEPRGYRVFAPAALAGIGVLPETIHDRSIVIPLVRAKPGEVARRFDSRHTEQERVLRLKLSRWAADNMAALGNLDPDMPAGAFNRVADNWRPLFAIANAVGGDWPERAHMAYTHLAGAATTDGHGLREMLLADIQAVFTSEGTDRISSAALCERLASIEGQPWAEWGKAQKPITPNQLARLLAPFGIGPHSIRIAGESKTQKGYFVSQFSEVFDRYLGDSNRNSGTMPENIEQNAVFQTGTKAPCSVSENETFPNPGAGCSGVPFQNGELLVEEA